MPSDNFDIDAMFGHVQNTIGAAQDVTNLLYNRFSGSDSRRNMGGQPMMQYPQGYGVPYGYGYGYGYGYNAMNNGGYYGGYNQPMMPYQYQQPQMMPMMNMGAPVPPMMNQQANYGYAGISDNSYGCGGFV
jgi:hypothetical protein